MSENKCLLTKLDRSVDNNELEEYGVIKIRLEPYTGTKHFVAINEKNEYLSYIKTDSGTILQPTGSQFPELTEPGTLIIKDKYSLTKIGIDQLRYMSDFRFDLAPLKYCNFLNNVNIHNIIGDISPLFNKTFYMLYLVFSDPDVNNIYKLPKYIDDLDPTTKPQMTLLTNKNAEFDCSLFESNDTLTLLFMSNFKLLNTSELYKKFKSLKTLKINGHVNIAYRIDVEGLLSPQTNVDIEELQISIVYNAGASYIYEVSDIIESNISKFNKLKIIRMVSISNRYNINSLAQVLTLNSMSLQNNIMCTGTIESFVERRRRLGQTSGTVEHINVYATAVTFNGQKTTVNNESNPLSWTETTITYEGTTITA